MKKHSRDFQECCLNYKREGHSIEEVMEIFKVGKTTIYNWEKESQAGFPEKPPRTCEKKINKEALRKAVEEKPDSELAELAKLFNCSAVAVHKALKKMGITRKKRPSRTRKNQRNNGLHTKLT
jgi:transposase